MTNDLAANYAGAFDGCHRMSEMPVASEAFESFDRLEFINGMLVDKIHVVNDISLDDA
jgi:hypothetical protein